MSDRNVPSGEVEDNDYKSRTEQKEHIPVTGDNEPIEDPIDADKANTDAQLEADEAAAIDKSNIVEGRTRGAAKASGTYTEPGDEEGLPDVDGTSSTDQVK